MAQTKRRKSSKRKSSAARKDPLTNVRNRPLRNVAAEALQLYFKDLNGHQPQELYKMVLHEIEPPLLEVVMDRAGGNQTLASEILGINRGTLRKKLKQYELL